MSGVPRSCSAKSVRTQHEPIALSPEGISEVLRRGVLVLGAALLLILPRLTTTASFVGMPRQVLVPEGIRLTRIGTGAFGAGPLTVTLVGLVFWSMLVLLVSSWVAGGRARLPHAWLALPVGLLLVGVGVSTACAADKSAALVRAAEMSGLWVGFFALAQAIRTDGERRILLATLVATALASALVAVYQGAYGMEATWQYFLEHREQVLVEQGIEPGSWREQLFIARFKGGVQAAMGHPNVLAAMLVLAVLVGCGFVREKWSECGKRGGRGLAFGAAAIVSICVVAIVLTKSRGGLGALVAGAYFLAVGWWVARRRLRVVLWVLPVGVAAAGLLAAVHIDHPAVAAALKTLRFRLDYWQGTWPVIRAHWATGVGLENFGLHYLEHKLPTAPEEVADPHNMWLSTWSRLGVSGLVGLVLLLAGTVRAWLRKRAPAELPTEAPGAVRHPSNTDESLLALPLVTVLIAAAAVVVLFTKGWYAYPAAVVFMVLALGFLPAEDPSRLEVAGRPLRSLGAACVAATVAFLIQAQIGTALAEPATTWALVVVLGASIGPGCSGRCSGGRRMRPAAKFVLMVLAMAAAFAYMRWVVLPVGREQRLLAEAAQSSDAFRQDEVLRAAGDPNPFAWEPALMRGQLWQTRAASQTGLSAVRDLERATNAYREALVRHPRLRGAYLQLAACRLAVPGAFGDPRALRVAKGYIEEAARLYPAHIPTRLRLADLMDRLGDERAALEAYREVLRLSDLMPDVNRRLRADVRQATEARVRELEESLAIPDAVP